MPILSVDNGEKQAISDAVGVVVESVVAKSTDTEEHFTATTEDGGRFFVKIDRSGEAPTKLEAEQGDLSCLRRTCCVSVPDIITIARLPGGRGAAMIMPDFRFVSKDPEAAWNLGKQLGRMHGIPVGNMFGFHRDNWAGGVLQKNDWCNSWCKFFSEHRLGYQANLIVDRYGDFELLVKVSVLQDRLWDRFFKGIPIRPSLLHGYLWAGNWGANADHKPIVYNPACYLGHAEVDISTIVMFGSPNKRFFEAYHELVPRTEPGHDNRVWLYQLHLYMVHYSKFGRGFYSVCHGLLNLLLGDSIRAIS